MIANDRKLWRENVLSLFTPGTHKKKRKEKNNVFHGLMDVMVVGSGDIIRIILILM